MSNRRCLLSSYFLPVLFLGIFREQQYKNTAVRRAWVEQYKTEFKASFEPPTFSELPLHVRQQTFPKYRGVALQPSKCTRTMRLPHAEHTDSLPT